MKITGARRVFLFTILIVAANVSTWGASLNIFPEYFKFFGVLLLSLILSLYVFFKVGDRIDRRKADEEDERWVKAMTMTMRDWMKSNPY